MQTIETEVLIVGGGVVGLTASMLLTNLGVDNRLYTYYPTTSPHPKSHILNQRSMEIFDELGVAEHIFSVATPPEKMRYAGWYAGIRGDHPCTGREIGRVEAWGLGYEDPDYIAASPCPAGNYPQMYLEPIIRDAAEARSPGRVIFNHEYLDLAQDDDGVTARIRNRATDEVFAVRARYLIAADGGKTIGPQLGIRRLGKEPFMRMASVHFKADFSEVTTGEDVLTRFLINPDIGGSWASGVLLPEGPTKWGQHAEEWLFHTKNPDQSDAPLDREAVVNWMYKVLGLGAEDIQEIIHVSEWHMQGVLAERYREGRVLLAGDACKVHPPTGGLGMNSGVQDVYNLVWKLRLVLQGLADDRLLDTYEMERRPVAEQNVKAAMANAAEHFHIDRALGIGDEQDGETNWANMARLWDDDPAHDALREEVFRAVQRSRIGFRHHNIEFGYSYREGALVPDGEPFEEPLDPIRVYQPSTRPGHPLPHAWISRGHGMEPIGALVSGGRFLVIAGEDGRAWVEAAARLAGRTGLPIRAFTLGIDEGDYLDMRGRWLTLRRTGREGVIVVRPDRYVGYHATSMVQDPEGELSRAFGQVAGLMAS